MKQEENFGGLTKLERSEVGKKVQERPREGKGVFREEGWVEVTGLGRGTAVGDTGDRETKRETYVTFRVHGDLEQPVSVSTTVQIDVP